MTKFARLTLLVVLLAQLFVPGRSTAMYAPDGAFPSTVGLVSSTVQATPTVSPDKSHSTNDT